MYRPFSSREAHPDPDLDPADVAADVEDAVGIEFRLCSLDERHVGPLRIAPGLKTPVKHRGGLEHQAALTFLGEGSQVFEDGEDILVVALQVEVKYAIARADLVGDFDAVRGGRLLGGLRHLPHDRERDRDLSRDRIAGFFSRPLEVVAVSYTHLTLPTIYSV